MMKSRIQFTDEEKIKIFCDHKRFKNFVSMDGIMNSFGYSGSLAWQWRVDLKRRGVDIEGIVAAIESTQNREEVPPQYIAYTKAARENWKAKQHLRRRPYRRLRALPESTQTNGERALATVEPGYKSWQIPVRLNNGLQVIYHPQTSEKTVLIWAKGMAEPVMFPFERLQKLIQQHTER